MLKWKLLKNTIIYNLVIICIVNLISCNSNVEVAKLSKEEATEQSESVNMDVIETTMALESSTQEIVKESLVESQEETQEESQEETQEESQEETQEETQIETQVETTIQETQQTKAQVMTGTDINGHPYIDPEKYATWEQQPVDMNVLKRLRDEKVEKVYQYMMSIIVDTPTEEKLSQIRQIVDNVVLLESEEFKNEYKKGMVYTFGADGKPIEAPPAGKHADTITNPSTGQKYTYVDIPARWMEDHVDEEIAREMAIRDDIMDSQGHTNLRKMTDEEMNRIAEGIARAMGD